MSSEPSFAIPVRPRRRFLVRGGVTYEGETTFRLTPEADHDDVTLHSLVERILADGPYRSGDFHDLPVTLWLVRDDGTGDVFRVSIRDGRIRLHVLPATESAGLRRFYGRLSSASGSSWSVECHSEST